MPRADALRLRVLTEEAGAAVAAALPGAPAPMQETPAADDDLLELLD